MAGSFVRDIRARMLVRQRGALASDRLALWLPISFTEERYRPVLHDQTIQDVELPFHRLERIFV